MDYRWQGPFVITIVLGKGLYSLTERWESSASASKWISFENIFSISSSNQLKLTLVLRLFEIIV